MTERNVADKDIRTRPPHPTLKELNRGGTDAWTSWAGNIQPFLMTGVKAAGMDDVNAGVIVSEAWRTFPAVVRDLGGVPTLDVTSLVTDLTTAYTVYAKEGK